MNASNRGKSHRPFIEYGAWMFSAGVSTGLLIGIVLYLLGAW